MKKIYFLGALLATTLSFGQTNVGITGNVAGVYINEIHYDNASTDVGEFIEVAGPAGIDLSTYTITLYDGVTGASYGTALALSGTIDNEGSGVGAVSFAYPVNGIQNGAPDSIALSKSGDVNIQFLSYEGTGIAATNGAAAGLTPVDIIAQEINTAIGTSLEYNEATSSWINVSDDSPGLFAQGPLGVKENSISGLKIYPNPVKNLLNITSDSFEAKTVAIYNVLGKVVLSEKVTNAPVNVANLAKGVYVVKVTEEGKTATRKLVIE
jgi:hypothetical protein